MIFFTQPSMCAFELPRSWKVYRRSHINHEKLKLFPVWSKVYNQQKILDLEHSTSLTHLQNFINIFLFVQKIFPGVHILNNTIYFTELIFELILVLFLFENFHPPEMAHIFWKWRRLWFFPKYGSYWTMYFCINLKLK